MANRKRSPIPGGFVRIPWAMLNNPAYWDLPPSAGKLLPYFLGKNKEEGKYYSEKRLSFEFQFTYSEAKRYGFSPGTFSVAFKAMIKHGFVDPVSKGGLRSDGKASNWFRLSKRWQDYGKVGFKEVTWDTFVPYVRDEPTPKPEVNSFKNWSKKNHQPSDIESVGTEKR